MVPEMAGPSIVITVCPRGEEQQDSLTRQPCSNIAAPSAATPTATSTATSTAAAIITTATGTVTVTSSVTTTQHHTAITTTAAEMIIC